MKYLERFACGIVCISAAITISSCSNDLELQEEKSGIEYHSKAQSNLRIVEGRIYFSSVEEFINFHEDISLEESKLEDLQAQMNPDEMITANPVADDRYLNRLIENEPQITNDPTFDLGDAMDNAESIIAEDIFRSLLNYKGEIRVADEIYKYTDAGLIKTNIQNYEELEQFVRERGLSNNLFVRSDVGKLQGMQDFLKNEALRYGIDNNTPSKKRWINWRDLLIFIPYNPEKSSNQAVAYEATNDVVLETHPEIKDWLKTISNCTPRDNAWDKFVSGLFGDRDICIDQYSNKNRVKTKAWNLDYGLFYTMGVRVTNQYHNKPFGWKKSNAIEIKTIVEGVQFEYDIQINNIPANHKNQKHFYSNLGWKYEYFPDSNWFNTQTFSINSLPKVFQSNLSFETFETGWLYLDGLLQNGIDSNLAAENLNDWFWKGAWTTTKSLLSGMSSKFDVASPNRSAMVKIPNSNKIIVQRSYMKSEYGTDQITKYFDYGGGIKISFNSSGGGSWSSSFSSSTALIKPKNYKIRVMGVVNTGSGWRGSKIASF